MKLDYEKAYREEKIKNRKKLINDLTKNKIDKKIIKYADEYGYNLKEVIDKVLHDEMFSQFFVKDPSRQNFHENAAANYISSFSRVKNFKQLNKGGNKSKKVIAGIVQSGRVASRRKTKSIDFEFELLNKNNEIIKVFVCHKYTKESGGSQDNQYADVRDFMANARENAEDNVVFIAICDGNYYQQKNQKNKTKIQDLNEDYYKKNKLKAITIEDLEEEFSKIENESF